MFIDQELTLRKDQIPPDLLAFFEPAECRECFVCHMVEVFGLVREVLTDDGVLFLNLGDSYAQAGQAASREEDWSERKQKYQDESRSTGQHGGWEGRAWRAGATIGNGLKPKDLCGVPWRVAFALQEAGWWLRQDLIWHKPSAMPESVTDRCTKAHEYVFLLAKSARYFFDNDAIREPHTEPERSGTPENRKMAKGTDGHSATFGGWDYDTRQYNPAGRNKRSVWTISSQAYSDAHFATFPEALVEPMILAGTSAHGHCPHPNCGKGWVRVVETPRPPDHVYTNARLSDDDHVNTGIRRDGVRRGSGQKQQNWRNENPSKTLGWQPSCDHNLPPVPGVVLDPFLGSGTTARVAQSLGRHWLGIELNKAYAEFQDNRITQYGFALS